MNTNLLLAYYEAVGHEQFRNEVLSKTLPPEIQECFDKIADGVKLSMKLDYFPVIFILED